MDLTVCAIIEVNRALYDKSMSFGTLIGHTLKMIFKSRGIAAAAIFQDGGHFPRCPPRVVVLSVTQALYHLGS